MEMEPQLEEMHPDELEDIRAHRLAVQEQLQRCDIAAGLIAHLTVLGISCFPFQTAGTS